MPDIEYRTAQALWYQSPGQAELRPCVPPDTTGGLVRVRSSFGAISRGTEALVYHGRVPVREYDRMRAPFQEGHFPFPVKYGYATVGTVTEGPDGLAGCSVFCLYPHQTEFTVPREAVTRLPETVPPSRAVLAANMETAVNAVWDAELQAGQTVSVVGAGVVGLLIGYVASTLFNSPVDMIDTDPGKAEAAAALGMPFTAPENAQSDRDTVFHASATSPGLATALRLCRFEGIVVEASWYGDASVTVPLGEDFHSRRLTIRSTQVGTVAPLKRSTMRHADRLAYSLSLLDNPALDVLFNRDIDFGSLPAALPDLFAAGSGVLCPRIIY
ncbi:MAG: zinc-binding alcohol dehydrogenase [Alphaproteobacteria bacterium]